MRAAIVSGASSGIGAAAGAGAGCQNAALAARRVESLEQLRAQLPNPALTQVIDMSQPEQAMLALSWQPQWAM